MRLFYNVPKAGEDQQFYTRYASLIPTLSTLSYLAQIVSALTEAGIIYAVVYSSIVPFWPDAAPAVSVIGSLVGTLFIELGLRKFIPFGARAVIKKRWQGWDGWITGFVLAVGVGLVIASGLLSFKGSSLLVESVAPEPKTETTFAADSIAAAANVTAANLLRDNNQSVSARYSALIESAEQTAGADIRELDNKYRIVIAREQRTGNSYATQKQRNRTQLEAIQADKSRTVAKLKADRANALAALQDAYTRKLDGIETEQRDSRQQISRSNEAARADINSKIANYGGGLAYFSLFCLITFVICVTIQELHRAGSGVSEQVEPGAFDFEIGPLSAFFSAVNGRLSRFLYGLIHKIESGTTDAPEPVTPPTVWGREQQEIQVVKTKGVMRRIRPVKGVKTAPAAASTQRRSIAFKDYQEPPETQPDATETGIALTHCVNDATGTAKSNVKIGNCQHCGTSYEKRTTWQKFCKSQCRKDYHAGQHQGNEFDPNFKPWKP